MAHLRTEFWFWSRAPKLFYCNNCVCCILVETACWFHTLLFFLIKAFYAKFGSTHPHNTLFITIIMPNVHCHCWLERHNYMDPVNNTKISYTYSHIVTFDSKKYTQLFVEGFYNKIIQSCFPWHFNIERGQDSLGRAFFLIFTWETTFVTSCWRSSTASPVWKGVNSARKSFVPNGSKFFSIRVDPLSEVSLKRFRVTSRKKAWQEWIISKS